MDLVKVTLDPISSERKYQKILKAKVKQFKASAVVASLSRSHSVCCANLSFLLTSLPPLVSLSSSMASKPLSAYATLKKFCHQEGFYHIKPNRDTNNGVLVLLEVRTSKTPGQGVIFSKVKWFKKGCNVKDNILNLLAYEFFESVGVPLVNHDYWLVSGSETKSQKKIKISTPKVDLEQTKTFDDQLDDALAEAEADFEATEEVGEEKSGVATVKPPATNPMAFMGDFAKMMGGIQDQSLPGLMSALSTPGGLEQVGALLQNPMMNQMMSMTLGSMFQAPKGGVQKDAVDRDGTPEIPEVVEVSSSSEVLLEKVE